MEQQHQMSFTRIKTRQLLQAGDRQLGHLTRSSGMGLGPDGRPTVPDHPLCGMTPNEARAFLLGRTEMHRLTMLLELVTVKDGLDLPHFTASETPEMQRAREALQLLLPVPEVPEYGHIKQLYNSWFSHHAQDSGPDDALLEDFTFFEALGAFGLAVESASILRPWGCGPTTFFYDINEMHLDALAKLGVILEEIEAKARRDRQYSEDLHAALGSGRVTPRDDAPLCPN